MTRATAVPILVFLGLSVLDLGSMYAIDIGPKSKTDRRSSYASSFNAPNLVAGGIISLLL